jgi:hypothetical protein
MDNILSIASKHSNHYKEFVKDKWINIQTKLKLPPAANSQYKKKIVESEKEIYLYTY